MPRLRDRGLLDGGDGADAATGGGVGLTPSASSARSLGWTRGRRDLGSPDAHPHAPGRAVHLVRLPEPRLRGRAARGRVHAAAGRAPAHRHAGDGDRIGNAVGDWVVRLRVQPVDLARGHPRRHLGGLLRGGRRPRRARRAAPRSPVRPATPARSPPARSWGRARAPRRSRCSPTSTPRWPRSRLCCASAASREPPDAQRRAEPALVPAERRGRRAPGAALDPADGGRPRRVRRQRRRPGPPGGRQADPGRLQVGPGPGAAEPGARPRRLPRCARLHPRRGAVARGAGRLRRHRGRLPDRRPRRAHPARRLAGRGRARSR